MKVPSSHQPTRGLAPQPSGYPDKAVSRHAIFRGHQGQIFVNQFPTYPKCRSTGTRWVRIPIVAADAVGNLATDRIDEVASDIERGGAGAGRVFVYVGGLFSGHLSLSPLARPRGTRRSAYARQ